MSRTPKATLFKKRGYWWINYTDNGGRHRISTGTKNEKLAKIKLTDIELRLFKGEMGVKPAASPKSSLPEFFRRYIEYIISESSVDRHSDISRLKTWQLYFARKNVRFLEDITTSLIDDFHITVLAHKKPKTVKNYIMQLKTALNKAVLWELIDHNQLSGVKPPKVVKTFHFFSHEEIRQLIDEAPVPLKTGIIILVNSVIRRAELYNLRWRDVDLENGRLRVWPYEGFSPKGKRPRSIPFTDQLSEVVNKLNRDKDNSAEYVFRHGRSRHSNYQRIIGPFRHFYYHDLCPPFARYP